MKLFKYFFIAIFYVFTFVFISPIILYIFFILILKKTHNKYYFLLFIFIVFNILILIILLISGLFWAHGVIHNISFGYALYNIIRVEWIYLIPVWIFFITWGILRLIGISKTWKKWINLLEIHKNKDIL